MEFIIVSTLGGLSFGVIGYFLKQTMDDLKAVKETSYTTKTKLEVLEKEYGLKHGHLTEKFDELSDSIKDLVKEIKQLNFELLKNNKKE